MNCTSTPRAVSARAFASILHKIRHFHEVGDFNNYAGIKFQSHLNKRLWQKSLEVEALLINADCPSCKDGYITWS